MERSSSSSSSLRYINAVEIVGTEGGVAFGAFPLARLVARLDAREAKYVEAFGQDGVLALDLARRARHQLLHLAQLLRQDLVGGGGQLELLHPLHLLAQVTQLLGSASLLERLLGVNHVLLAHRGLQFF